MPAHVASMTNFPEPETALSSQHQDVMVEGLHNSQHIDVVHQQHIEVVHQPQEQHDMGAGGAVHVVLE